MGSIMAASESSAPSYTQLRTTFAEIFWSIWKRNGYQLPGEEGKRYCYMFVLRSDEQQLIIARGKKEGEDISCIALHGMRDLETLDEYEDWEEHGRKMGWPCVQQVFYSGTLLAKRNTN